ncbi:PREDICTED: UDP-xylose and UDP-N-acetylglucosamine transporter-like isoform X2 [Amphimedon queenslandica]|uniref:Sugar phosphate transporter domain-containing protein n=1 Tax=Amphimedon queenslandica TaxID=400682 RepID=A0A1X7VTE8_AMPQE|nr:PREDICTED: UDP-xylose and UDP-N-acetylglucosamine transporter-like isoform X2 [Amphimedon queenslandica]|eukprot:XP_019855805.1 PREDICTED: UDP-xylose and UDP-N-acetylglucosamine transporter-like isoform X2 [Amphimedon queenslandica]
MSLQKILVAVFLVFFGCCSSVVLLELLIKYDTGSGNIITFSQFLFIAVEGLFVHSKFFTVNRAIPLRQYLMMVTVFFSVSVINNYALNFNIPLPLHMIFRSGSLLANMVLGIIIMKKKYPLSKYVAVAMISIGIVIATLASTDTVKQEKVLEVVEKDDLVVEIEDDIDYVQDDSDFMNIVWMTIGVLMLSFALFMSAAMGIFQEIMYKKYGKHPKEAMFYSHALPLPGFLIFYSDLYKRVELFNASDPVNIGIMIIPIMWIYLFLNAFSQYMCISGVFVLTTECPSLVVTLIITLRKFVSLLFSILYFQNPFTTLHWIGTALVFSGTLLFTGFIQQVLSYFFSKEKAE